MTDNTKVAGATKADNRMFPVRLLKHYVPLGEFDVVGHHRPEVKVKDSAGRETIVQEAGFVEGEMTPAPYPGTGYPGKVWAGTVIKLPLDEARSLADGKRAERADALPA